MRIKKDALTVEKERLARDEQRFLQKRAEKKDSALNRFLAEKVPEKLQATLDAAFAKAFAFVFEKGTSVIELSYNKEEKEKQFKIDEYTAQVRGDKKSLRSFSQKAGSSGAVNLALSGAAGIGLGILGIGLPDIALFTSLMLKSIYEIALSYGYEYESENEKKFILRIISGAVSYGEALATIDAELNAYIDGSAEYIGEGMDALINQAASGLSKELLYMKFLQGIPIVGVVGGAYDAVYMKSITEYAKLKYRRRFFKGRK